MRAPAFWFSDRRTISSLVLAPLAWLYGWGGRLRNAVVTSQKVSMPVVCIGNFVAGGAGKTPTALALATLLERAGTSVGFLTRGYGGKLSGPVMVEPDRHSFHDVGDEALLLAKTGPTIVAKDRRKGAAELCKIAIDIIIMDDGFQNPSLHKDISLIVIDHNQGVGNHSVIPAGPLRASLDFQISRANGFVVIGGDLTDQTLKQKLEKSDKPLFTARLEAAGTAPDLAGKKVIAFTGIGIPEKFFATLQKAGVQIVEEIRFPDHHPFSQSDAEWLLSLQSDNSNCLLVTTAKDHIRLKNASDACARLYQASIPYEVVLKFDHEEALLEFVLNAV